MSFSIVPIILAGGSGTRLWPLSRPSQPKQFLNLVGKTSLFQETLKRLRHIPETNRPVVVCNVHHQSIVMEQIQEIGIPYETVILEPLARNTAPAIAVATAFLESCENFSQSLMLVLPTDHLIQDTKEFIGAIEIARSSAIAGKLVTFGIRPDRPATGYGYIKIEGCCTKKNVLPVKRFLDKPSRSDAEAYLLEDDCFWNSGMFMFSSEVCLTEMERLSPTLVVHARDAFDHAATDLASIRLKPDTYEQIDDISFDAAVMERSDRVSMVPMEAGWNDLGSWTSLWESGRKDEDGNVTFGDVCLEGVKDSFIHSDSNPVIALGMDGVVIVETQNGLLVASKEYDQNIARVVNQLEMAGGIETQQHHKEFRPWGNYVRLDGGHRFQVKRITVKPGCSISLQKHRFRSEHWVVVSGIAEVTCGIKTFTLHENESTYIPAGTKHRLRNIGQTQLEFIEVQTGTYFGEDDIQRFEDEDSEVERGGADDIA